MAIKLIDIKSREPNNKIVGVIFADTKQNVIDNLPIEGLGDKELSAGSKVITASGEVGLLNSSDTWTWIQNAVAGIYL